MLTTNPSVSETRPGLQKAAMVALERRETLAHNSFNDAEFLFRRISSWAETPFSKATALLNDHVTLMHKRMVTSGGPNFDHAAHSDAFWATYDSVLPPNGSYYLVSDPSDQLVGTGALRRISDTEGEMKHLYVRPEVRGRGIGRKLVEARMADARAMGLQTLLSDSFDVNYEMRALYESIGFRNVPAFTLSATSNISPELLERMVFFRYDFGE